MIKQSDKQKKKNDDFMAEMDNFAKLSKETLFAKNHQVNNVFNFTEDAKQGSAVMVINGQRLISRAAHNTSDVLLRLPQAIKERMEATVIGGSIGVNSIALIEWALNELEKKNKTVNATIKK